MPFDVCITERVLMSLTDDEAVTLSAEIRNKDVVKVGGTVVHIETPIMDGQDPTMNFKSLADWKILLPDDIVIRSGGGAFL